MIVDDLQRSVEDGSCLLSARVRHKIRKGEDRDFRLWYRFPEEFAVEGEIDASPFVPPALYWCLRTGEDLTIDGNVSPRLMRAVDGIMRVYRSLFPDAVRGPIAVSARTRAPAPGRPLTACLFTRGVDSWYALLEALDDPGLQPPITHVIFSPHFNAKGWGEELREAKTAATAQAAERAGCRLIRFESNVKFDLAGRGRFHAAALAVGLSTVLIPSGNMHGEQVPAGTHPAMDHRFSTERSEVVHYGDASRIHKVERIAHSEPALQTISVCRDDHMATDRNCGRCEKCVRTMLELHVLGALDRCHAFDAPLEVSKVAAIDYVGKVRHMWVELLHRLGKSELDRALKTAVRLVILRNDLRAAANDARRLVARDRLNNLFGPGHAAVDPAQTLISLDRRLERMVQGLDEDDEGGPAEERRLLRVPFRRLRA